MEIKDVNVLQNKFDIKDQEELREAEDNIAIIRLSTIFAFQSNGNFE